MAVFYLPVNKLELYLLNENKPHDSTPQIKDMIHNFLMEHHGAYTLESSNIQGFWRSSQQQAILLDSNVRYEVSFDGKEHIEVFVKFLSEICALIDEEAIYLTMGNSSYLVYPEKGQNEV